MRLTFKQRRIRARQIFEDRAFQHKETKGLAWDCLSYDQKRYWLKKADEMAQRKK